MGKAEEPLATTMSPIAVLATANGPIPLPKQGLFAQKVISSPAAAISEEVTAAAVKQQKRADRAMAAGCVCVCVWVFAVMSGMQSVNLKH